MKQALACMIPTGAEAELFTCRSRFARLDHDGELTVRATDGVALRLQADGRVGHAYGYGVPLRNLVADAEAALPYGQRRDRALPPGEGVPQAAPDEPLRAPPVARLFSVQNRVLDEAEAALPDTPVTFAAEASVQAIRVENTTGLAVSDRRSRTAWHLCTWSAGGCLGVSRWWSGDRLAGPSAEELAGVWSEHRLLGSLETVPVASGPYPVLLAPEATGALLLAISKRLSAGWPIGLAAGSPLLTVVDDPDLAGGMYCTAVDDEGVRTAACTLISQGRVTGHLANRYRRSLFQEGPEVEPRPGPSNLVIQPGTTSEPEILKLMGSGLWVVRTLGDHLEPAGDDVVVRVDLGFLVRDGQPRGVVRNVLLHLSLPDALHAVVALSDCRRPVPVAFRGAGYAPSILFSALPVTGGG